MEHIIVLFIEKFPFRMNEILSMRLMVKICHIYQRLFLVINMVLLLLFLRFNSIKVIKSKPFKINMIWIYLRSSTWYYPNSLVWELLIYLQAKLKLLIFPGWDSNNIILVIYPNCKWIWLVSIPYFSLTALVKFYLHCINWLCSIIKKALHIIIILILFLNL